MSKTEYYLMAFNHDDSATNKMSILSYSNDMEILRKELRELVANEYLHKFAFPCMPDKLKQYSRIDLTTARRSFFSSKLNRRIELYKGEHFNPTLPYGFDDFGVISTFNDELHVVGEYLATLETELDGMGDHIDNATIIFEDDYVFIRYQYPNDETRYQVALQIIEKI